MTPEEILGLATIQIITGEMPESPDDKPEGEVIIEIKDVYIEGFTRRN